MIRRILSAIALAAGIGIPAFAQQSPLGSFAIDFNYTIQSQQPNVFTVTPGGACLQNAQGINFFPFAVNAPVYVQDITAANSERLTPTSVVRTGVQCGVTVAPANQHYSFRITSGTAGLQEALNSLANGSAAYAQPLFIDKRWKSQIATIGQTPATVIGAVKGNVNVFLVDTTTLTAGRFATYSWNGTAYVAN